MVARIVTIARVRVIDRRPALRGMAGITVGYGNKMIIWPLWFTANRRQTVMTRAATIDYALVIENAADEGRSGMTERAIERRGNVIRRLTRCRNAMTRSTIVCDTGMVERCRDKAGGVMAYAAILIGWYVTVALTCRKACAMTRCTIVRDADMVERRGQKTRLNVTVAAVIVGRHMIVGFASGGGAVVT